RRGPPGLYYPEHRQGQIPVSLLDLHLAAVVVHHHDGAVWGAGVVRVGRDASSPAPHGTPRSPVTACGIQAHDARPHCSSMIITSIHPHPRITRTGTREGADAGQFPGQSTVSAGDGAFCAAVLRSARGVKLMSHNASPEGVQVNRSLMVGGGLLVGIGGLLGFTGMVLVGS